MDITSLIAIVVAIIIIYLVIKFIVSPLLKIVFGIILILIILYFLQKYLGFDPNQILSPFGISFKNINLDWLSAQVDYCLNQIKNLFLPIWKNIPKN